MKRMMENLRERSAVSREEPPDNRTLAAKE